VVYFTTDGRTITWPQLTVEVGVKETAGDRPLCYCFGHSIATIKGELRMKGHSDALEDIRQKMKDPGCTCPVTNPSGSCCLGAVGRGIETAQAELNGKLGRNRGETISKVGTVLSAVLGSACCWLPLVLLAFGLSGAGIAGALESYRPVFITLTVVFLAAAFYFTYRPRPATVASGDCCAAPGPTSKRRFNPMTLNKVMLWVVTVLAVAFLFFPNYTRFFLTAGGAGEPAMSNPLIRTTTFSVQGMTCEGCSVLVEQAIQKTPGVLSARVDYERKRAVVTSEACCSDPTEAILAALQGAGYRATVVEAGSPGTGGTGDLLPSDCCAQPVLEEKPEQPRAEGQPSDSEHPIVFKVQGLTCPAVKGIGCGHRLAPVLERLDKIAGVRASSTNYTGTLIRVSLTTSSDRARVVAEVLEALADNKPVVLEGPELQTALAKEQWRETRRVGELSAIEFRALTLYRLETFARAEKLDKTTTDKLVKMAEDQWERLAREAGKDKATRPEDWGNRCKKSLPVFLSRARDILTGAQLERLEKSLMTPCRDGDRPEAPPERTRSEKSP
jgi:copper chaperone CopZ